MIDSIFSEQIERGKAVFYLTLTELSDMVGNDLEPDQTIEELVMELLADCLPWLRQNHWPKYRLEDY